MEGNLVRDPEAKLTPKGTPVCKFAVASNRSYKAEGVRQEGGSHNKVKVVGEHVEFKPQSTASAGPGDSNESEDENLKESVEENASEEMEEVLI